jgi:hypothetical protein
LSRHTSWTEELQERICRSLQAGIDVQVACSIEGIGRSTYYEWQKRGRAGEEPYAGFLAATDAAMDRVERAVTSKLLKIAMEDRGNWQAAAWWLRFRKTGGKQQVELTGAGGAPLNGVLTREGAEEIRKKVLFGESEERATLQTDAPTDSGSDEP